MNKTQKTAKTHTEYQADFHGYQFIVSAGSTVSNLAACGPDDNYRFLTSINDLAERVSGFKDSMLRHDLQYYGLNIPAEYCEPYEGEEG